MTGFIWTRRCLSLILVFVVFIAYVGLTQAAMIDWVNRCCIKGRQKAENFKGHFEVCNKDDLDRRTFTSVMDRMVCRMSERVCCVKELQKVACERGKYQAFQAKSCARPHGNAGADRYIECCDCCALGIKARSVGVGCDTVKWNDPCKTVYQECCSGQKVTASPYLTLSPPILTPAPSTKQPIAQRCAAGVCQHICREDSSRNPICYCRNGYFIASDSKNCLDVNECTMSTPVCSDDQKCINTEGSYRCIPKSKPTPTLLAACSNDGYELVRGSCQDINECERGTSTCSSEQTCVNTIGSYRCTCARGYEVSGQRCVDKDECRTSEARCPPGSVCRNLPGTYICSRPNQCPAGKRKTASGCVDIDECAGGNSPCGSDTRCINTDGSYRCVPCGKGFRADNNRCVDKNECTNGEARCPQRTVCRNTPGSYTCTRITCPAGKRSTASGCVDIDECATNLAKCTGNRRCINTDGSYRCAPCPTGTRAENNACVDIDECAENRYRCQSNQKCVNTPGSYRCVDVPVIACLSGYENVNGKCVDIDECVKYKSICPSGKQCKNEKGSYSCLSQSQCQNGYKLVNGRCEDIDECVEYRVRCPTGQVCSNIRGSYRCERRQQCTSGYEFKNGRCLDIDECTISNACRSAGQRCENYAGSYRCVDVVSRSCSRGYKLVDGKCVVSDDPCADILCPSGYECKLKSNRPVCKDIDECLRNPCKRDETCVNKPGTHLCVCKSGYEKNQFDRQCRDINECFRGYCEHNCVNSPPGSFTCSCHPGFRLDINKRSCIDINECATQRPCQNGRCTNTRGSYYCSCHQGFRLTANGRCEDIDECNANVYGRPCEYNCTNIVGSYRCECPSGYEQTADRHSCRDIDECKQGSAICGRGTLCRNTNGHYRCIPFSCPRPYYSLQGDSKCLRNCPEGDRACSQLKDKVYQFWTFNIVVGSPPGNIFAYKIIAQGYRKPDIRYRFRRGNELGHFEIKRVGADQAQIWNRITFRQRHDYVLEFVGELFDGGDLISRYVHTLYVFVSAYR
ncbi:fibulin-1-like [Actinia tenebrosa]|uniref:Fibulin-1-like n=1 Tax=Actinia tenebrosa TaxID=6105 RepID=A0A6P8HD15_ACTTE|nr:fibulin-1-like [Actinia tenebrosa]